MPIYLFFYLAIQVNNVNEYLNHSGGSHEFS